MPFDKQIHTWSDSKARNKNKLLIQTSRSRHETGYFHRLILSISSHLLIPSSHSSAEMKIKKGKIGNNPGFLCSSGSREPPRAQFTCDGRRAALTSFTSPRLASPSVSCGQTLWRPVNWTGRILRKRFLLADNTLVGLRGRWKRSTSFSLLQHWFEDMWLKAQRHSVPNGHDAVFRTLTHCHCWDAELIKIPLTRWTPSLTWTPQIFKFFACRKMQITYNSHILSEVCFQSLVFHPGYWYSSFTPIKTRKIIFNYWEQQILPSLYGFL